MTDPNPPGERPDGTFRPVLTYDLCDWLAREVVGPDLESDQGDREEVVLRGLLRIWRRETNYADRPGARVTDEDRGYVRGLESAISSLADRYRAYEGIGNIYRAPRRSAAVEIRGMDRPEGTACVNLMLLSGERVDAIVSTEDAHRVFEADRDPGGERYRAGQRVRVEVEDGRSGEAGHFLLEYAARYSQDPLIKELAQKVFARVEED